MKCHSSREGTLEMDCVWEEEHLLHHTLSFLCRSLLRLGRLYLLQSFLKFALSYSYFFVQLFPLTCQGSLVSCKHVTPIPVLRLLPGEKFPLPGLSVNILSSVSVLSLKPTSSMKPVKLRHFLQTPLSLNLLST